MKDRYYIIIILLIGISSLLFCQEQTISKTITDNNRNDRKVKTNMYIPKKDTIHHLMIVAHGFVMNADAYKTLASYYQERNFIVVVLNTEKGLNADQLDFAQDISFVRKWLIEESEDETSDLICV